MDPVLLQKQVRDNSQELQNFLLDLKNWEQDMKRKDQQLHDNPTEGTAIPPVRSKIRKTKLKNAEETIEEKNKRISSYDYSAWDKFDVEKACEEVDTKEEDDETEAEDDAEKQRDKALYEKELGNQHVKSQRWKEAIDCYSRAIQYYPYDAIFFANRALCFLKTNKNRAAETDCTTAIQLDATYVKAYQRRALARVANGQREEARADFNTVLALDPNNSAAQSELAKLGSAARGTHRGKGGTGRPAKAAAVREKKNPTEPVLPEDSRGRGKSEAERAAAAAPDTLPAPPQPEDGDRRADLWPDLWPDPGPGEPVLPVHKPPHLRSKEPLQTIVIKEVEDVQELLKVRQSHTRVEETCASDKDKDNDKDKNKDDDKNKNKDNDKDCKAETPSKQPAQDRKTDSNQNLQVVDSPSKQLGDSSIPPENKPESVQKSMQPAEPRASTSSIAPGADVPSAPKTSVQFLVSWKLVREHPDLRYQYLKQVSADRLPQIFQNSLESREFSEVITALQTDFVPKNEPVYALLNGFTKVKRFSALVMFLSKAEKTVIKRLIEYCQASGECSKEDSLALFQKYEVGV